MYLLTGSGLLTYFKVDSLAAELPERYD